MAEFSGRYDVGSLESTERKYSDWELVKRIIRDYMLRHRSLVAAMALIIVAKTALVLSGPYIYKVTLDTFISDTPEPNEVWLANIIRGIATMLGGGVIHTVAGHSRRRLDLRRRRLRALGRHEPAGILPEQARAQHHRRHQDRLLPPPREAEPELLRVRQHGEARLKGH